MHHSHMYTHALMYMYSRGYTHCTGKSCCLVIYAILWHRPFSVYQTKTSADFPMLNARNITFKQKTIINHVENKT